MLHFKVVSSVTYCKLYLVAQDSCISAVAVECCHRNMKYLQVLLFPAFCILLAYIYRASRHYNLPPGTKIIISLPLLKKYLLLGRLFLNLKSDTGPIQLPIIGNILQVYLADSTYPHRAFVKLAKKYGNVLWVRIGSVDAGKFRCKSNIL